MNLWIGTGRITANPELKNIQSSAVCNFTIACDRSYKKDGQPTTDFIPCVAWGKTAEFISKYFTKGSRIEIIGEINIRSWQDKDGNKKYATEIKVSEVHFGGDKKDNSQNSANNTYSNDNYASNTADDYDVPLSDDDLPF